ncbi:MAG: hypothetical protein ACRDSP_16240 [Pseudonocardiaceae bacterium]
MTLVVSAILLVCLGLLLGAAWTTQALQLKFREYAKERRRLDEEWRAMLATRSQWAQRQRYGSMPPEQDEQYAPTGAGDQPDDD